MKAHVYSLEGKKGREIALPRVFDTAYNPEVISRAVIATQTHRLQRKGSNVRAGFDTSAEYIGRRAAFRSGINRGIARLPHIKTGGGGTGRVMRVPQARGGHRSHPPRVEKVIYKEINKKEYIAAIRSAIAATANAKLVTARGHRIEAVEMPLVVEDAAQKISKTKDALALLNNIGLGSDLARGKVKTVRAGQSTMRGNKYRRKRSVLVVVADGGKAFRNLPGVDVATVSGLSIEQLAPGATAGRLTVYTEASIKQLGEKYGN